MINKKNIIFILVLLSPPFLKKCLLKWFMGAHIGRRVKMGWFSSVKGKKIEIGDYSEIRSLSLITCDGNVKIGRYSIICNFAIIFGAANITIGDHCYIGFQSMINTDEDVKIGNHSSVGHYSMVFTHGSFLPYTEGYRVKFGRVNIGNYVWIPPGVFIHPGIEIGDQVIINSKSVVKNNIPAGVVAEGFPAKPVIPIDKIKRSLSPEELDARISEMVNHFSEMILKSQMGIIVNRTSETSLSFSYRGHSYVIVNVASNGASASLNIQHRYVFLINHKTWTLPAQVKNSVLFNFNIMKMIVSHDEIGKKLYEFMFRYYGVPFEHQS